MRKGLMLSPQTDMRSRRCASQRGFSILEMLIASVILMIGIIGVVQLVPASLQLNASNRYDTLSTVIAQRELDQMLAQPIDTITFTDSSGNLVSLGGAGSPGAPVVMQGPMAQIDFTAAPVDGFSISSYMDPNDPNFPNGATFELRWAVIPNPTVGGGRVISKRIILGCRQTNAPQPMLPVNLDSWKFRGD
jgi:type II secretory pathway pseudopilin PulG